jgi:hypothetical protein
MSTPLPPRPAKLVIGLFMGNRELLAPAALDLVDRFGPVDMVSPWFAFDFTSYYAEEMGAPLFRRVLAFKRLVGQHALPEIKIETNRVEDRYRDKGSRRVNIDPGYLLLERFVLATGKNFSHRIYLDAGIYADLTLVFSRGEFRPLPWTYPDYAHADLRQFLQEVRSRYHIELLSGAESGRFSGQDGWVKK